MSATQITGLIGLGIILLTNFALLVKDHVKVTELVEWREEVNEHMSNTKKHIDPERDGDRWRDLTNRMDRMEKKLDNILTLERGHKSNRGDSTDA